MPQEKRASSTFAGVCRAVGSVLDIGATSVPGRLKVKRPQPAEDGLQRDRAAVENTWRMVRNRFGRP